MKSIQITENISSCLPTRIISACWEAELIRKLVIYKDKVTESYVKSRSLFIAIFPTNTFCIVIYLTVVTSHDHKWFNVNKSTKNVIATPSIKFCSQSEKVMAASVVCG